MNAPLFEVLRARCHDPEPDTIELEALISHLLGQPDAELMVDYVLGMASDRFQRGDPGAWALLRVIHREMPWHTKMPSLHAMVETMREAEAVHPNCAGLMADLALSDAVPESVAVQALGRLFDTAPKRADVAADAVLAVLAALWSGAPKDADTLAASICAVSRGSHAWDAVNHAWSLGCNLLPEEVSQVLFGELMAMVHADGRAYLRDGGTGAVMAARDVEFAELDRFVEAIAPACAVASFVRNARCWSEVRRGAAVHRLWSEPVAAFRALGYTFPEFMEPDEDVVIASWASRSPVDLRHAERIALAAAESLLIWGCRRAAKALLGSVLQATGGRDPWAQDLQRRLLRR